MLVSTIAPAQAMVGGTIKRLATLRSITLLAKPTRTFYSASSDEQFKKMTELEKPKK